MSKSYPDYYDAYGPNPFHQTIGWLVAVTFVISGIVYYFTAPSWEEVTASERQYHAYMRECVPKLPEWRCIEIYRWTGGQ